MKKIKLSQNKYAIIDDADFDFVNQFRWSYKKKGYAFRLKYLGGGRKNQIQEHVLMHRLIMNAPKGMDVDHINGDKLDNRRSNLRICTRSQNNMNSSATNAKSGHRGVYYKGSDRRNKKWIARVCVNGIYTHSKHFETKEEAIVARQELAKKHFGEFNKKVLW